MEDDKDFLDSPVGSDKTNPLVSGKASVGLGQAFESGQGVFCLDTLFTKNNISIVSDTVCYDYIKDIICISQNFSDYIFSSLSGLQNGAGGIKNGLNLFGDAFLSYTSSEDSNYKKYLINHFVDFDDKCYANELLIYQVDEKELVCLRLLFNDDCNSGVLFYRPFLYNQVKFNFDTFNDVVVRIDFNYPQGENTIVSNKISIVNFPIVNHKTSMKNAVTNLYLESSYNRSTNMYTYFGQFGLNNMSLEGNTVYFYANTLMQNAIISASMIENSLSINNFKTLVDNYKISNLWIDYIYPTLEQNIDSTEEQILKNLANEPILDESLESQENDNQQDNSLDNQPKEPELEEINYFDNPAYYSVGEFIVSGNNDNIKYREIKSEYEKFLSMEVPVTYSSSQLINLQKLIDLLGK